MRNSYRQDNRPSWQFYPKDWLSSVNDVRLCSLEARGLWIDLLCIMFFSPIRGALLNSNGIQMTYKDLTKITGEKEDKIKALMEELRQTGSLSELDDGTIVNRRMYNEELHRKQISEIRRQAIGKRWGYKNDTKNTTPSSSSSSSSSSKDINTLSGNKAPDITETMFNEIYTDYPNKDSRKEALGHFKASVANDEDFANIKLALKNYLNHLKINTWKQPKSAKTWFNNWKDWIDYQEISRKEEEKVEEDVKEDYIDYVRKQIEGQSREIKKEEADDKRLYDE